MFFCRSCFKTCVFELFSLLSNNVKVKINRTLIFVNFYGRETLSLALGKEYRLRMFENTVLRKIFVPKRGRGNRGVEKNTYRGAL